MQRGLLCWAVITLGSRRAGAAHGLPLHPWPVGAGVSSWRAQKATLEALRGRLLLRAGPPCEILGWTVAAWDRENRLVRPATSATLWNIPSPGFCSNCSSLGTPPLLLLVHATLAHPRDEPLDHGSSASHSCPFNNSLLANFPGSGQRQARLSAAFLHDAAGHVGTVMRQPAKHP